MMKRFINISNHPSSGWTEEQKAAAVSRMGGNTEIRDVPFPAIDPAWTTAEVEEQAREFCAALAISDPSAAMVHIMGEMTFVAACVRTLHSHGVCCVASTTKRVSEEVNGEKRSRFTFVQFREYPEQVLQRRYFAVDGEFNRKSEIFPADGPKEFVWSCLAGETHGGSGEIVAIVRGRTEDCFVRINPDTCRVIQDCE